MTARERIDILMEKASDDSLPAMLFLLLLAVLGLLAAIALFNVIFQISVWLGIIGLVGMVYWFFIKITNRQAR